MDWSLFAVLAFGTLWIFALLKWFPTPTPEAVQEKTTITWLVILGILILSVTVSGLEEKLVTGALSTLGTITGVVLGRGMKRS
jgi:hypothetical protein